MQMLYKAEERGHANHGWLDSYHSFSFAGYYDPNKMNFGSLRVLNDDTIAPGTGFDTHPHDNMEIISIPLEGKLAHKDSMGNGSVIEEGDIQIMSAGTGILHSEFNGSDTEIGKFLQIWIFPKERNIKPRYDQISIRDLRIENKLYQIVSPDVNEQGVQIMQDAWFHMGEFDNGVEG
jgi:redox-sensitive bicupin YhaK (pirin superfamily)